MTLEKVSKFIQRDPEEQQDLFFDEEDVKREQQEQNQIVADKPEPERETPKAKRLEFRDLRADEIDCRISTVKETGLSLLLYKDARCDMNVLDETVGPFNWKRAHSRDNANCTVSIWDDSKYDWVSKEDTGTESNTEAEKGLASDSFKRACFNWGIGRELYTAPFIWIKSGLFRDKYDKFEVQEIKIVDKKIVALAIYNRTLKKTVYTYGDTEAHVDAPDEDNSGGFSGNNRFPGRRGL